MQIAGPSIREFCGTLVCDLHARTLHMYLRELQTLIQHDPGLTAPYAQCIGQRDENHSPTDALLNTLQMRFKKRVTLTRGTAAEETRV